MGYVRGRDVAVGLLGAIRPHEPLQPADPPDPPLLPNSAAIVSRLVGWGDAQSLIVGHPDSYAGDYNHPVYYNSPDDPLFTVECTRWQALCAVQGMQLRIPDRARPASGGTATWRSSISRRAGSGTSGR